MSSVVCLPGYSAAVSSGPLATGVGRLVTRTGLHPFLARSWCTERTTISATSHQRGPFAWPTMGLALAALAMRIKHLAVRPVVDEDGYILGVLTADRATGLLAVAPTP
ncbi:hypothetical protein ACFU7Y_10775 [Kitasatospora sp. NPDC057542]|uniref:hypothetical protein n=1 Tax=Streptomycetaceae TaxID=2062 RepID=UPI001CCB4444|nr:hypothetical protein [Streptomyces sp. LS1784]